MSCHNFIVVVSTMRPAGRIPSPSFSLRTVQTVKDIARPYDLEGAVEACDYCAVLLVFLVDRNHLKTSLLPDRVGQKCGI